MIREIKIPINRAFNTAPITMDTGKPAFLPNLLRSRADCQNENDISNHNTWERHGMAAIIGLPVMKKEVIGVITLKMMPQARPAYTVVKIRAALMIGVDVSFEF